MYGCVPSGEYSFDFRQLWYIKKQNQLSQNNLQQKLIIVVYLHDEVLLVLISYRFGGNINNTIFISGLAFLRYSTFDGFLLCVLSHTCILSLKWRSERHEFRTRELPMKLEKILRHWRNKKRAINPESEIAIKTMGKFDYICNLQRNIGGVFRKVTFNCCQ